MSFNPADFASAYISQDEVLEIKKAFDLFDRDLGGAIDPKGNTWHIPELKTAINSLGIEAQAQAVYQMIAEIDKDGSGQIEFHEFFEMMTTRPSDNESRE
jgi:centrin-1